MTVAIQFNNVVFPEPLAPHNSQILAIANIKGNSV